MSTTSTSPTPGSHGSQSQSPTALVLLDYGGVVVDSPVKGFAKTLLSISGGGYQDEQKEQKNKFQRLWADLECGRVTVEQFCERVGKNSDSGGHDARAQEKFLAWFRQLRSQERFCRPNPQVVHAISRLRRDFGVEVGLVTNNFRWDGGPPGSAGAAAGSLGVSGFEGVGDGGGKGLTGNKKGIGCTVARSMSHGARGMIQVRSAGSTPCSSSQRQASIPVLPAPTTT